jgi:hypothetical protein
MLVRTLQFWRSTNDVETCSGSGFPLTSLVEHLLGQCARNDFTGSRIAVEGPFDAKTSKPFHFLEHRTEVAGAWLLRPRSRESRSRRDRISTLSSFVLAASVRPGRASLNIRASSDSHSTECRKTARSIPSGNRSRLTIHSQRTGRQQAFHKAGFDPTTPHTQLCNSQVDFQPAYSCSISAQARSHPRTTRLRRLLNYFAYNFITIHRTLRMSPAMAAGVTDRL